MNYLITSVGKGCHLPTKLVKADQGERYAVGVIELQCRIISWTITVAAALVSVPILQRILQHSLGQYLVPVNRTLWIFKNKINKILNFKQSEGINLFCTVPERWHRCSVYRQKRRKVPGSRSGCTGTSDWLALWSTIPTRTTVGSRHQRHSNQCLGRTADSRPVSSQFHLKTE